MKKTSTKAGLKRSSRMEFQRDDVERIEQERIDFEHRARMLRTNLYNTSLPNEPARGWVDARRK